MDVDIRGSQGNAFALMGNAERWGKQLGWSRSHIDKVLEDMQSGDYEHLLDVIEKEFEHVVTLVGRGEDCE